jgi:hypothetical protein
VRDAGAGGSVGPSRQLVTVEDHVSGAAHRPRHGAERRRLPGAVRAEDRDELARADFERDPVQHFDRAVPRLDVAKLEERRHASAPR